MHTELAELAEVDAREYRHELIELYRADANDEFESVFDWYYTDLGLGQPKTWVLRRPADGTIIGTISVVLREFLYQNRPFRVGFAGNLLVHPQHRNAFAAFQLVRASRSVVDEGLYELLVGLPLESARGLLKAAKYHHIGTLRAHTHVTSAAGPMRARFGLLGRGVSPFINVYFAARRAVHGFRHQAQATELALDDLAHLDLRTWSTSPQLMVVRPSREFVQWLASRPGSRNRVFGLSLRGDLAGIVNLQEVGESGATITAWLTNNGRVHPGDAIMGVLRLIRGEYSALSISTLGTSDASEMLRRIGFVRRKGHAGAAAELLGYWKTDHPLHHTFVSPASWDFFPGLNDI